ncbi:hypothetical protein FA09DRAFT_208869 [Tilletiopsis washingtonensis]|uniref:Uncharacterized protein n=1 Tax=Tilletiopsis washingtonensis TaxID=58919 RepID=A0A316ZIM1_9BASI|nr:hypothetical protein FA09DRAFT_208869 [Tilletiopsis washingtonensis]PWO00176.1 hypothetical protein FA09DRAFT_208869 [Tilletiopsis washingtonensis]
MTCGEQSQHRTTCAPRPTHLRARVAHGVLEALVEDERGPGSHANAHPAEHGASHRHDSEQEAAHDATAAVGDRGATEHLDGRRKLRGQRQRCLGRPRRRVEGEVPTHVDADAERRDAADLAQVLT